MVYKFVKNIAIFLLPVALALIPLEFYLRSIPNAYKLKNDYMTDNSLQIRTLVLGSSHAYRGVNAGALGNGTFNAAYPSQDFKRDCFIFDKYSPRMDSLKTVIMSISYFSFAEMMEEFNTGETQLKYYGMYMDYPSTRYSLEISIPGWTKKLSLHLKGEGVVQCDSLGFGDKHEAGAKQNLSEKNAKATALYHTYKDTVHYQENLNIVRHIAKECQERGIRLLLVTFPATDLYCSYLDSTQLARMYQNAHRLESEFDNVMYLDFLTDRRFSDSDFFDSDHLSFDGATRLANILKDYIR